MKIKIAQRNIYIKIFTNLYEIMWCCRVLYLCFSWRLRIVKVVLPKVTEPQRFLHLQANSKLILRKSQVLVFNIQNFQPFGIQSNDDHSTCLNVTFCTQNSKVKQMYSNKTLLWRMQCIYLATPMKMLTIIKLEV